MPATVFHFKRFTINQDRCAMKVGTDGVLLGAWVTVPDAGKILDIGTGTGLIALMMAQKSNAFIDAIDIDLPSYEQAKENVLLSPWSDHVRVIHSALKDYKPGYRYDLIVSNPPYFMDSYAATDEARNLARSASASLSYDDLLNGVVRLLVNTGRFSVILPHKEGQIFREKAEQNGLFCNKLVNVRTGRDKPFKRVLMDFSRREEELMEEELVIHFDSRHFTEEYKRLTGEYYPAF
ncbi:MAG: methyltransferase [Bacteroidetes bacterium]|nr:methyltransferase [Bacteroidota bacterium]